MHMDLRGHGVASVQLYASRTPASLGTLAMALQAWKNRWISADFLNLRVPLDVQLCFVIIVFRDSIVQDEIIRTWIMVSILSCGLFAQFGFLWEQSTRRELETERESLLAKNPRQVAKGSVFAIINHERPQASTFLSLPYNVRCVIYLSALRGCLILSIQTPWDRSMEDIVLKGVPWRHWRFIRTLTSRRLRIRQKRTTRSIAQADWCRNQWNWYVRTLFFCSPFLLFRFR